MGLFGYSRDTWNALKGMEKKIYFQNICILLMSSSGHVPNNFAFITALVVFPESA